MPFASGAFDLAMSFDVLQQFGRARNGARSAELARVVKPGGLLALRVSAFQALRSRHSEFVCERQRYTRPQLRRLVETAGFRVLRATYANTLLSPVALLKFRSDRAAAIASARKPAFSRGRSGWIGALTQRARRGSGLASRGIRFAVRAIAVVDREKRGLTFPSLSVFFPAYNDAPSLPALLAKTFETLDGHVADYEVIVVNDGSRDETAARAGSARAPLRSLSAYRDARKQSRIWRGAASRFAAARKDFVFYTDGDGQYDPGELPLLLERMGPKTGLVNGYKIERNDPLHRVWIGGIYNFCARVLFRIRDPRCGLRFPADPPRAARRHHVSPRPAAPFASNWCANSSGPVGKWRKRPCITSRAHHGQSQFFRLRPLLATFGQFFQPLAADRGVAMSVRVAARRWSIWPPCCPRTRAAWAANLAPIVRRRRSSSWANRSPSSNANSQRRRAQSMRSRWASGTAALEFCLRAAGLGGSGAEVVIARAHFALHRAGHSGRGLPPRFADVDEEHLLLDPARVGKRDARHRAGASLWPALRLRRRLPRGRGDRAGCMPGARRGAIHSTIRRSSRTVFIPPRTCHAWAMAAL